MDKKSKTRSPPKKTAKRPKVQAKEQSERFIETARALGADESGRAFNKAIERMLPPGGRHSSTDKTKKT